MTKSSVVPLAEPGNSGQRTSQIHVTMSEAQHVVYVVRLGLVGCSSWHVEQLSDFIAGVQRARLTGDESPSHSVKKQGIQHKRNSARLAIRWELTNSHRTPTVLCMPTKRSHLARLIRLCSPVGSESGTWEQKAEVWEQSGNSEPLYGSFQGLCGRRGPFRVNRLMVAQILTRWRPGVRISSLFRRIARCQHESCVPVVSVADVKPTIRMEGHPLPPR
jgi:hypothetical protein